MMTYIDYLNRIWLLNRMDPFTPSERELLYYLLNECNTQYWKMPVRCPTSVICATLGLSKMSIMRARDQLKERGIITFTEGVRNSKAPLYTITMQETTDVTTCVTTVVTSNVTTSETTDATFYKDKETREKSIYNKESSSLDLNELERRMVSDVEWHQQIQNQLAKNGIELPSSLSFPEEIEKFVGYLRVRGYQTRPEDECRTHFYNKIKKEYSTKKKINNNGINESLNYDKRRGCNVTATSPQNYDASF